MGYSRNPVLVEIARGEISRYLVKIQTVREFRNGPPREIHNQNIGLLYKINQLASE
jgi:hypothetical protein